MPNPTTEDVSTNTPIPLPPTVHHRDGKWYVMYEGVKSGPYDDHATALETAWTRAGMTLPVVKSTGTSGCMVAFRPPYSICSALVDLGNEQFDSLHITVVYIGDNLPDSLLFNHLIETFAHNQKYIFTATITGFAIFSNNNSPVLVALVDIPNSTGFRAELLSLLRMNGIEPPENHGWLPHITLAYGVDENMPLPSIPESAREPFVLDLLIASVGDMEIRYPLVDSKVTTHNT